MSVYIIATMDTKGTEARFVADALQGQQVPVQLVDVGSLGEPATVVDIPRQQVFALADISLAEIVAANDRGQAVTQAALGAARLVREHYQAGRVDGVLSLGGSAGTTIGTSAMRSLPLGVPKIMVSTLASGQVQPYVGGKDIMMMNAVVDIAGINRISRNILGNAAAAMVGMIQRQTPPPAGEDRPLVAATMFGVTTPCVNRARELLDAAGYEVLVFHATGSGGQALEALVRDGLVAGVLDITTTELADELVGGTLSAGPDRLTAAAQSGTPQVVSVGATDMVNFGPRHTVPVEFRDRKFYQHNANVTLMRTTPEENAALGREIAAKVAKATGPTAILLPLRGVSAIDQSGQPFDDPAARQQLFDAVRANHGSTELVELDQHINDAEFAETAARMLLEMMKS